MAARKSKKKARRFQPAARVTFRSPLLPFEAFASHAADIEPLDPGADDQDFLAAMERASQTLRTRLAQVLREDHVRDALFLASPGLQQEIAVWQEQPTSARGRSVECALIRYFARMAARPTPFGLFSGISVGRVDENATTHLAIPARAEYQRHTRLDNDYLFALTDALGRVPEVRAQLRFWPNESLFQSGERLRYVEARLDGKRRSHHLVKVERDEYLDATLDRAGADMHVGATADELAQALVDDDPEIEFEEARDYIDSLIEAQILVSRLAPAVTGEEPINGVIHELELVAERGVEAAESSVRVLREVRAELARVDSDGLGASPERYQAMATSLEALPVPVDLARLFQVDMVKRAPEAVLGGRVLAAIERGVDVLRRIPRERGESALDRFKNAFRSRYEDRAMPLMQVLDEDSGIGFMRSDDIAADPSPLLHGLRFPARNSSSGDSFTRWHAFLARQVHGLRRPEDGPLELSDAHLRDFADAGEPVPLPGAFSVMATVAAGSRQDLEAGRFQVHVNSAGGPSGARLTGRFCHASPEVEEAVREHLRAEESLAPDAIFAEIVHLPEGRIGNVICRPVLRAYEIPYLGISGAPPERQLRLDDLVVSVERDRIVLRSQTLGREVIPRLSTAHNLGLGVGVYRFLGYLQSQGTSSYSWSWGPLESLPYLPRVTCGRVVLARAHWRLEKTELEPLAEALRSQPGDGPHAARARVFRAWQTLREKRSIPRFSVLADSDNELPLDADNPASCESVARLLKKRQHAVFAEFFPGPDALACHGPEGRFTAQLVVPFTRARRTDVAQPGHEPDHDSGTSPSTSPGSAPGTPPVKRAYAPGSEWLYAKIYAGYDGVDQLLDEALAPFCQDMRERGLASSSFFIRYGDPDHHVRIRWRGEPARLTAELLPALHRMIDRFMDLGIARSLVLDTYVRETERYGGPAGIELAESAFDADSRAVLEMLPHLRGDTGGELRWQMAVAGTDALLDDLGFDIDERFALMSHLRDGFGREFNADAAFYKRVGERFRERKHIIERVLAPDLLETLEAHAAKLQAEIAQQGHDQDDDDEDEYPYEYEDDPLLLCARALARRSEALRPLARELRERSQAGALTRTLPDIAGSYIHMYLNRLNRSAPRAQELIVYDYLRRIYASRRARRKGKNKNKAKNKAKAT